MNEENWVDMASQLDFSFPKKTCKQPSTTKTSTTPITNQFGILTKDSNIKDVDMEVPNPTTLTAPTKELKKIKKCPPVIVTDKVKHPNIFHRKMKEIMKEKFVIKYYKDEIKITTNEPNDYRNLISTLKAEQIEFYTYTPKEDTMKKIVVKAACFTTEEEIKSRLSADHKLKQEEIQCLKMKGKGQNTHSFLVSVPKRINLKDIKKTSELDHIKLEWQTYLRKSKVAQCFRCQRFGHGSGQCFQIPRCVKCGNNHLTQDCHIKERNSDKIQCANCSGPHTANYRLCPSYTRYVESLITARKTYKTQPNPSPKPILNTRERTPLLTYVNATKNSTPESNNKDNFNEFQSLLKEIQELKEICDISQLISLVRELKQSLKNTSSPLDKLLVIQNLAQKYGF